jgi:putative ABC transport system ATP-binding protein
MVQALAMDEPILKANALKAERGGKVLFSGLSFVLQPGERLFVQAPSGAGKTTLLRMLALLEPLDDGRLFLQGKAAAEWSPTRWRRKVVYVSQRVPNLEGTPNETLAAISAFKVADGQKVPLDPHALAEEWDLPADKWDETWVRLSGGERQRALLALALCLKPDVLLLDEPTSALDHTVRDRVWSALQKKTAMWISHDPAEMEAVGGRALRLGSNGAN